MESKIIQNFKAEINGIVFENFDIFCEVEYILGEIENTLNVSLPTEFIKDFADAYTNLYNLLDGEYLYNFKCDMVRSWDENIKDIRDIRFNLDGSVYIEQLELLNNKIADWDNTYGKLED